MSNIDHFKSFNYPCDHVLGDEVLRKVAHTLLCVKGGRKTFRSGGEEFAIFLQVEAKDCKVYLENLRQSITTQGFTIRSNERAPKKARNAGKKVNLTISIGAYDSSWGSSILAIAKKQIRFCIGQKSGAQLC